MIAKTGLNKFQINKLKNQAIKRGFRPELNNILFFKHVAEVLRPGKSLKNTAEKTE